MNRIQISTHIPGVALVVMEGETKVRLLMSGSAYLYNNHKESLIQHIETSLGEIDIDSQHHLLNEDAVVYDFKRPRGLFVKPEDRPEPSFGYYDPKFITYEPIWDTPALQALYDKLKI